MTGPAIYPEAQITTVLENLWEAAVFPSVLYPSSPPWTPFPFGPDGTCLFKPTSRFKGRAAYDGTDDVRKYPMLLWFGGEDESEFEMENAYLSRIRARVTCVMAFQNKDLDVAEKQVRDCLHLVREYCGKQHSQFSLTYGPFGCSSTAVVPATFGSIQRIHVDFGENRVRPEPELGPDRVIGAVATEFTLWVQ